MDRLLVFSGVVMANLILLAVVMFALSEPGIFVVALALVGAFFVVCWWSSRDASLVKLHEGLEEKSLDVAGDAEAIAAIWALLGVSRAVAAPRHHKVSVRFGPLTLRDVLEEAKRFQGDVVGEYFRSVAKNHDAQSEKEEWHRLVGMSEAIVDQIGTAIEAIPAKDMGKSVGPQGVLYGEGREVFLWPRTVGKAMSRHGIRYDKVHEVCIWLFAGRIIRNIEGPRRISDAKARAIRDLIPARARSDEGSMVAWYVTSAAGAWGFFSREHLTSPTVEQIKSIMLLAEELSDELLKVKGDSIQGTNQDGKE